MLYWLVYFLLLIIGSAGLIALIVFFQRRRSSSLGVNMTLLLLAVFLTLMGLELYFKLFFRQPENFDTLAHENWMETYYGENWQNSLDWGYRDIDWTDDMVAGKTKVMVVGDSFVEGKGIENPADRFPDLLAGKLGPEYVVFNVGKSGTNTAHQIQAIVDYPYAPDVLILSYVLNDIRGALTERQWLAQPDNPQMPPLLKPLIQHSYAVNFLYWRLVYLQLSRQPDEYWEWYLNVYNDPDSWWMHQQQLETIFEGARAEQIPLFVVVFPGLDDIESSRVVTEKIIGFFEARGVPTLDVADFVEGIPIEQRKASPVDSHPSELVHRIVADELYRMLAAEGVVK